VVVFTASHKWYADSILDYIDPTGKLIQHRLYREHCIKSDDNVYIKDLRVFKGRDLKDLLIVDNAVYSFGS
jgi:CTD small phosphatase-like protein 2